MNNNPFATDWFMNRVVAKKTKPSTLTPSNVKNRISRGTIQEQTHKSSKQDQQHIPETLPSQKETNQSHSILATNFDSEGDGTNDQEDDQHSTQYDNSNNTDEDE